jgi:dTDP-4-amino-4,6-dideoxygalactose transaminase
MKIELIDLKKKYQDESKDLLRCVNSVIKNGSFILTKEVTDFEKSICKLLNIKYCLGLNSGTDALLMSLMSLGISRGDEVITSPISFVATAHSIVHVGAKPVFADIGTDLNIDPNQIERLITKKTKAIMPVHWTGRLCEMDKIKAIAKKYNLKIIEDAAQAIGAKYNNLYAGTFGDISAFSTHPLKNLNGIGDGGFVVTNSKKLHDKIKRFRNHGMVRRDVAEIVGLNSRLDSVHAKILSFRLTKLNRQIQQRNYNISLYEKYLNTKKIQIIKTKKKSYDSSTIFITLCENRNSLQKYLSKYNIQSLIYYKRPLHMQKSLQFLGYKKGDLPIAENLCKKVLALPHHQYLKEKQVEYICSKINKFYN